MVSLQDYLRNPCGELSIPYWKAKQIILPEGMKILHQSQWSEMKADSFTDEPYFRLIHRLQVLLPPQLPQGYSLCDASLGDYAEHINQCYGDMHMTEAELQGYTTRPVYVPSLWLAVREDSTHEVAATGIAELDRDCGEGALEWIQVSEQHRSRGLGTYLVAELLWRMKDMARFVTVSGRCGDPNNPEGLYRKCGFTGNDVWHILRKRCT